MKHRFPFGGISGSPVSQGCAVETKWVGKNGLSAAEILWDLMRLELIAHHEGADAFFVLAGRRKHLEAFFESRAFLGSPKADRSYRRLLKLDRGRNPRIRIDSPAADRLEIIKKLVADYQNLSFATRITTSIRVLLHHARASQTGHLARSGG